ncbi:MAG: PAS domain S-box protein [Chloroflexi bacterium]|nr:PAS domain S-box protein [Chloroflexota bacterium]
MSQSTLYWLFLLIAAVILGGFTVWARLLRRSINAQPMARNTIMDNMTGIAIVLDAQNRIMDFNRKAQTTLGLSPATIGAAPISLPPPWNDLFKRFAETQERKCEVTLDFDGAPHIYELTISPILDKHENTLGCLFLFYDITERKRAERALLHSEEQYRQLIDLMPDGVATYKDGRIVFVNPAGAGILGAALPAELIGRDIFDFVHPDSTAPILEHLQKSDASKERVSLEDLKIIRLDGQFIDMEATSQLIEVDGAALILAVFRDITERKQAEEKLLQLSRAVEQSPASIMITNTAGIIEYVNPRFSQVTGYSFEEAIGKNPRFLSTDKTKAGSHQQLWGSITAGQEWQGEFVNRKKNGELYYEAAIISPIIDARGVTTHYLAVKEDITERKKAQDEIQRANQMLTSQLEAIQLLQTELREQAIRDPLTGLYNRRYLDETLDRELARAEREGYPVSFMVCDIDHFKKINDSHGHQAGDMVLQNMATQLTSHARVGDIICRYGGDEFLVILPDVSAEIALQIAERSRKAFEEFMLVLENNDIQATLSCGIAAFPQNGTKGADLIAAADRAMYLAKAAGRNCVSVSQRKV